MDNTLSQHESGTQQPGGSLAGLQIFDSILLLMRHSVSWLAGLLKLTEEEREAAGVYLGRPGGE